MQAQMPLLPNLTQPTQGLTISLWISPDTWTDGRVLLNSRGQSGQGLGISMVQAQGQSETERVLQIELSHGRDTFAWHTDRGRIEPGRLQHVVFVIDAGPRIISSFVNGAICDGAGHRQFGWARYPEAIADVNGNPRLEISPPVLHLQIFTRYLRGYEVVGLYRSQLPLYASP